MSVIVETKLGIDPHDTDLIEEMDEYYLFDENGVATPTGYLGVITGNHLKINNDVLEINPTGTDSECFQWNGSVLEIK